MALLANHAGSALPPDALDVMNRTASRARLGLELTASSGWAARVHSPGIAGGLGALIVVVADAMAAGTWSRLKVCANDTCRWAFYDESRARTGRWCSMKGCGNRAKQQAWRARHGDPRR